MGSGGGGGSGSGSGSSSERRRRRESGGGEGETITIESGESCATRSFSVTRHSPGLLGFVSCSWQKACAASVVSNVVHVE